MTTRTATAVALTLILASPAFADCNQELKILRRQARARAKPEWRRPSTKRSF
jgi:hypothetical protein